MLLKLLLRNISKRLRRLFLCRFKETEMSDMKPQNSIIIPSANPILVMHTIEGLLKQDLDNSSYEIIIVTPNPAQVQQMLKNKNVMVVGVDNLYPPGKMRNIGAGCAHGEMLFFIDDDCIPPSDWICKMLGVINSEDVIGATGCRVVSEKKSFWCHCADYALFSCCQYNRFLESSLGAGALVVRKLAYQDINGFDESLLASEDWDFCLRLQEKKWKSIFTPIVEVTHNHRRDSFLKILKSSYLSGLRSGLIVQSRHMNKMSWLAKLSLMLRSPWFYWLLILPYSGAVSLQQLIGFLKKDLKVVVYYPMMLASRMSYHFGVWRQLMLESQE